MAAGNAEQRQGDVEEDASQLQFPKGVSDVATRINLRRSMSDLQTSWRQCLCPGREIFFLKPRWIVVVVVVLLLRRHDGPNALLH